MKALAREPDDRFASAQELRAALEGLIRTSGWESDRLALSTYMRELFAGKLRAQAADVAAAGLASLEDYLLTVEEKTSISWMVPPADGEKKTPSTGLPPSRPASGPQPALKLDAERAGDAIARSSPIATTLRGGDPAPSTSAGVIIPSPSPLKATPTAATMGVVAPEAPASSDTPSMNLPASQNPLLSTTAPMPIFGGDKATPMFGSEQATGRRRALLGGGAPTPLQRVLVAGSAAALVAAVALTIAFWPAKPTTAVSPAATTATPTATTNTGEAGKATFATLLIRVDAPATIAVDGQAQPMGDSVTVNVQPGVEHVVTVQRPGHSMRKLHVPALAPGEHMPLRFTVR